MKYDVLQVQQVLRNILPIQFSQEIIQNTFEMLLYLLVKEKKTSTHINLTKQRTELESYIKMNRKRNLIIKLKDT